MKILKIFGIVVGIHVLVLIVIFSTPGCSSTNQPAPTPTETVAKAEPPVSFNPAPAPSSPAAPSSANANIIGAPPVSFNPDAPAVAAAPASSGSRYVPTRPNTPVVNTLIPEPVADVTPASTYTVKSGDSLWTIAKKHHLSAPDLAAANSLSTSAKIQPGQKLLIPGKAGSVPAAAAVKGPAASSGATSKSADAVTAATNASRTTGNAVKHTVKSGETLGAIARIYGVKAGDIAVANNISDPAKVPAGAELVIPGWQAPAGKSGKGGTKSGAGATKGAEAKTDASPVNPPPVVPVIPLSDNNPFTPAPKP